MDVYAIRLATGQSLTVPDSLAGNQPTVYNGPGTGTLVVVLNPQQYYDVIAMGQSGLTDISNPKLNILHVNIPTSASTFIQGEFSYCGFSISASAAATMLIQDANGAGTGATGTAAAAQTLDPIAVATGAMVSAFYPPSGGQGSGVLQSAIPISPGPNGGLAVASITGTFTGVVRIGQE